MQIHQDEPRRTLDIDFALCDRSLIPRTQLLSAGFIHLGDYVFSENWTDAGLIPVQFTDAPLLRGAVDNAEAIDIAGVPLKAVRIEDLLHAKLRAASEGARCMSKRNQDLGDVVSLLEQDPSLSSFLTEEEHRLLEQLPH